MLTGGFENLIRLGRPLERNSHELAAADFAGRLDDDLVFAIGQLRERRLVLRDAKLVLAGRTRRAGQAVDRHRELAARAAPPLAHVLEPFGALVVLELEVVPDRDIADEALVGALEPHRNVRAVIFGDVQPRDFDRKLHVRGKRRPCGNASQCHRYRELHRHLSE